MNTFFERALPVWEKDRECEKNYTLLFRTIIDCAENAILRITGASIYQIFVNGTFVATGPARAAHGYYRVDEISLDRYLSQEKNVVVIQVAGYYINSFYLLEQPAFLCAEVIADGVCIAATGDRGFVARPMTERVQKVQRYSYQRTFVEVYDWNDEVARFKTQANLVFPTAPLAVVSEEKRYLKRGVFYPLYEKETAQCVVECGKVQVMLENVREYKDRSYLYIGESLRGYTPDELTVTSTEEVCKQVYRPNPHAERSMDADMENGEYVTYSFGKNLSGIVSFDIECMEPTTLYMTFDEVQIQDDYGFRWSEVVNVVIWKLDIGAHHLVTFEPYVMQYVRFASVGGSCRIRNVCMTRYGYPQIERHFSMDCPKLRKVYDAAIETFRQNVFDIFMDCPSRERAGWLCDSFFMGRTEYILTGKNEVERNFLENYAMSFNGTVPEGMVPMCYPADFELTPEYIPQWGIWFVIELADYYKRTGDDELIQQAKARVDMLCDYFAKYENEYGLLEHLDGVNMIEWSESRKYMYDVNFPTNMLYAMMLENIADMYGDYTLVDQASQIRKTVLEMSYQDGFFVDNAVRTAEGSLQVTTNKSECCQYFAFFTGLVNRETCPELWDVLVKDFGFQRRENHKWPDIALANAFIGNYLRMELLSLNGEHEMLIRDLKQYFYYMAERTGTLWEHEKISASCNHGFASYVAYLMVQLGIVQ